jgi:hypothetical protein
MAVIDHVALGEEDHQQISRLRSTAQLDSTSQWWRPIRSNPFASVKEMTSLKGKVLAFEGEGDEVDGFFKSLEAGQQSMTASPSSAPSVSVMPSTSPSEFISGLPTPLASEAPSVGIQPSTFSPTPLSSNSPSVSVQPSTFPTVDPSEFPIDGPTVSPTKQPTNPPTASPSSLPTFGPTADLSEQPSTVESGFPTVSSAPSMLPTLEVCQVTPEQRIIGILAILDQVADSQLIRDPTTPQGQATEWILNDDELNCPTDPKLIQRWALAVFYFSTEGDDWELCSDNPVSPCNVPPFVDDSAFLSEVNECEWAGIRCNTNGCVTDIEFENNGLAGTIPTELALLTALAFLGLEQGATTGTIPSELGSLSDMFFIDLDFNQLTGTIPSEIYGLTLLRTLDLNDNQLIGFIDSSIGNLSNLDFFQIHNNFFLGTIPSEIGNLSLLNTFTLYNNNLVGEMPNGICELRPAPLRFLIADCGGPDPDIQCDLSCCSGCRAT